MVLWLWEETCDQDVASSSPSTTGCYLDGQFSAFICCKILNTKKAGGFKNTKSLHFEFLFTILPIQILVIRWKIIPNGNKEKALWMNSKSLVVRASKQRGRGSYTHILVKGLWHIAQRQFAYLQRFVWVKVKRDDSLASLYSKNPQFQLFKWKTI